jgi:tetratricopeptide (TPR) repeat protein
VPAVSESVRPGKDGKFINILPGWYHRAYFVTTDNDSAQQYFSQGLNMYYSYHMKEAEASFKESSRWDPNLAMAYWGQALAMGPKYNISYSYHMRNEVPGVITRMNQLADGASNKEKDLIDAMNSRYLVADGEDHERKKLNQDYALKMRALVDKYPGDLDIKALYVDAVMLMHEWDFWNNDGTPKPWTPELVAFCKDILEKNPRHTGTIHYYIHVTEASHHPEVALPAAQALRDLMPGVSHMIHMSSHAYERTGLYVQGTEVNEKADEDLGVYRQYAPDLNLLVHNSHLYAVEAYCALSGGMYKKAMEKAYACRSIVHPSHGDAYEQFLYSLPAIVCVRLGKWDEILADKNSVPTDWIYAGIVQDFAKGMACAHSGRIESAKEYLKAIRRNSADGSLDVRFIPYLSTPREASQVASGILSGTIYISEGKTDSAIASLHKAIEAEDSMIYGEPKIWMLPARQYLGAVLLQVKRPGDAEKVYRDDLMHNPGNGWSMLGLSQSLEARGKPGEAKELKPRIIQSFQKAESMPTSSAY